MQLSAGRAGNFHSPHLGSSDCTPAPGGRSSPPGHGWPRKARERLRVRVLLDTSHQSVLSVTPPRGCRAHWPRHTPTMLGGGAGRGGNSQWASHQPVKRQTPHPHRGRYHLFLQKGDAQQGRPWA